ncbi:MAG TPA: ice-binding family protein, partial [Negativicutes bacterium]|nr:ice-binding family protein [Negativicutes bacterium]
RYIQYIGRARGYMIRLKVQKIFKELFVFLLVAALFIPRTSLAAETTVNLRTTSTFAILAGTTITNTGPTTVAGDAGSDIGLHPGTDFPGSASVTTVGAIHLNDAVAEQAKQDLVLAYDDAAGRTPTTTFAETDNQLGGKTLTTGVYRFGHADTANLTASQPLILDAQGDPNAVFIFQATSDLVFASNSVVQLINGARYCRVFWQVASDVTINSYATFVGHIFAMNSIWVRTGATVQGQLLARNGEVTLDTNTITNGLCATVTPSPTPGGPVVIPSTGDEATPILWVGIVVVAAAGLTILLVMRKRRK